jgi:transcriptional regulator with XRE-family HTH domain
MPLMRPLAAVLRLVRLSRGLSQEELSGAVEARHVHNIENAKTSITLDRLETLAQRLEVDAVALLAYASRVEKGLGAREYSDLLQAEIERLEVLGINERIHEYYQEGEVVTHKPGRRTDPAKVKAVLDAKMAGKSKRETAQELGIARSTVNDIWEKS